MTRPAYTVVWEPDLLDAFANRWLTADSDHRAYLTQLSYLIDTTLASAPESVGRPWRDALLWAPVGLTPTTGVVFRVSANDRTVTVARIFLLKEERGRDSV